MMLEKMLATLTPEARADVEGWIDYDPSLGVAIEVGVDWEGPEPESAEDWTAIPDSRGGWYKVSYGLQPVYQAGVMSYVVHEVDDCGNWGTVEEIRHDSPTFDADMAEYDYRATVASWKAYEAFVAETGTDPIGNFLVSPIVERAVTISALVEQEDDGCHITRWKVRGEAGQQSAAMPIEMAQYLYCTPERPIIGTAGEDNDPQLLSLDYLLTLTGYASWRQAGTGRAVVEFPVTLRTPRPPGEYAAELRALASRGMGV